MEIEILNTNITQVPADLVALKNAGGFHGADKAVARAIGFSEFITPGEVRFCKGSGVAAAEVAFISVGPLHEFRYERIHEFGRQAIKLARQHQTPIRHLALTVHGPGYGLDPEQAFLSMIAGIIAELKQAESALQKITVADYSVQRCGLLKNILQEHQHKFGLQNGKRPGTFTITEVAPAQAGNRHNEANSGIAQFGSLVEEKPRIFVAMPFSVEFQDEYEIGFHEAAKANSYVCERLDQESFTGDIVAEIKTKIIGSHGMIALLNNHNPNVFLEIGFAMAHGKPTILVAKEDVTLPFDVSALRCIRYRNLVELRKLLSAEIANLKAKGILKKVS